MSVPADALNGEATTSQQRSDQSLGYLQRAYDTNLGWYRTVESKAQLLLTINGIFITVVAGLLARGPNDLRAVVTSFGWDTWLFLVLCAGALAGSVVAATSSLWSVHSTGTSAEFEALSVKPDDPSTYRPEILWYFGHLARLKTGPAAQRLVGLSKDDEIAALAFNIFPLARNVLRKHRLVNMGWAFTGLAVLSLLGVGGSVLAHAI